jgi:hypothetical protein
MGGRTKLHNEEIHNLCSSQNFFGAARAWLIEERDGTQNSWGGGIKLPCQEKNSMARVRERTMPTERPPLVGEVNEVRCKPKHAVMLHV